MEKDLALKKIGLAALFLLILAPQSILALAQGDPDIFLEVSPAKANVAAGGSVKITVTVHSTEGFEGNVKLALTNPPKGVTAEFEPNPVDVPAYETGAVNMTVSVASDAAQGKATLTVTGTAVHDPKIARTIDVELNIGGSAPPAGSQPPPPPPPPPQEQPPPQQQPVEVRTVTVTTISISTTTFTTTDIITTRTSTIYTKTDAQPSQVTDYTVPLVTAVVVIALISVAAVALRRGK